MTTDGIKELRVVVNALRTHGPDHPDVIRDRDHDAGIALTHAGRRIIGDYRLAAILEQPSIGGIVAWSLNEIAYDFRVDTEPIR